jgi:hypothetical protein
VRVRVRVRVRACVCVCVEGARNLKANAWHCKCSMLLRHSRTKVLRGLLGSL